MRAKLQVLVCHAEVQPVPNQVCVFVTPTIGGVSNFSNFKLIQTLWDMTPSSAKQKTSSGICHSDDRRSLILFKYSIDSNSLRCLLRRQNKNQARVFVTPTIGGVSNFSRIQLILILWDASYLGKTKNVTKEYFVDLTKDYSLLFTSFGGQPSQIEGFKKVQSGFIVFIRSSFFCLLQPFISFSLAIALLM